MPINFGRYTGLWKSAYQEALDVERRLYFDAHGRWPEEEYFYTGAKRRVAARARAVADAAVAEMRGFSNE